MIWLAMRGAWRIVSILLAHASAAVFRWAA
jgi:hypothetical protein